MSGFFNGLLLILLFVLPYVILYYNNWINSQIRAAGLRFKLPDLLNFYLIIGIFLFSPIAFSHSITLLFLIVVSLIAIILATHFTYVKKEFITSKFLRIWWRFVFLIAIIFYTFAGIAAIFRIIF